jgi:LPS sulfotransferase NodH
VQQAVVLAREDTPGEQRLVAYVVPAQEGRSDTAPLPPTGSELRTFLQGRLPGYMVPNAFVFLEALPLTPSGKVDRKALPAPDSRRSGIETGYVPPRNPLEQALARMWQEILSLDLVGIHDNFFELGGDSIRGAIFINRLQKILGQPVYVVALFEAPTVASLASYLSQHYPDAVLSIWGPEALGEAMVAEAVVGERVDAARIAHIRQLIPPLPPILSQNGSGPKNPPAIFVLSPPRSGSTLLRAMLAGHPLLFAPPELELLSFNTLAERKKALQGRYSFWLEGTIRALMEIKDCTADEAWQIMEACEQQLTTKDFYGLLQRWIAPRLLVDKTPAYALDLEILKRMEANFDRPRYIHLLRHPCGMIHSFVEARLEQVFFRYDHPFSRRELAELIWLVCQQNILAFLREVPAERQHVVVFEELVRKPQAVMQALCDFLGLDYHPAMLRPYEGQRMTDGIHPLSKMLGDVRFHQHRGIDPSAADRWKEHFTADSLGDVTWQLAESLGYERPAPVSNSANQQKPPARVETLIEQERTFHRGLSGRRHLAARRRPIAGRIGGPLRRGGPEAVGRRVAAIRNAF